MDPLKRLSTFLYGFVPASALLCSVDGGPPPDGGALSPPAAPVTPPTPSGQPVITPEIQAVIDTRLSEERTKTSNAVWKQAREKYEKTGAGGQQPTPPRTDPPPSGNGYDALAILALRDAFDDATSDLSLSGAQKKFVRDLVMRERPADVAEYVTSFAKLSGWNNTAATPATPATASAAPKTTPQGPPVTGSGAPANSTTVVTDDTPLLRMSEADRIALRRRIGDGPYVDRMRKEFREGNVRVKFGR